MGRLMRFVVGAAMTTAVGSVHAARVSEAEINACRDEIAAHYGEETEIQLVNMRPNRFGTKVRMAVRLGAKGAKFVTCWIPRYSAAEIAELDAEYSADTDFEVVFRP